MADHQHGFRPTEDEHFDENDFIIYITPKSFVEDANDDDLNTFEDIVDASEPHSYNAQHLKI